ncbi:uncharacterized protein LOC124363464 [Homalodisca vitripennis]|uniref:uncharacterized protein LOC124363464 n=1 Tax=Homalodisca vitripennis TaxID=197043 RepID=UPI001EEB2C4C|nr:uncharacterized protein LOC124363464 [Homalodisca vitripennis]
MPLTHYHQGCNNNTVAKGEILWRQILEKNSHGTVQLMHVDVEMVTVTGSGPYTVRGWNINLGNMLYEWSITTVRWRNVKWAVHQGKLYMVNIGAQEAEVSVYKRQGRGSASHYTSLRLPHTPDKHKSNHHLVAISADQLKLLDFEVPADSNIAVHTHRRAEPHHHRSAFRKGTDGEWADTRDRCHSAGVEWPTVPRIPASCL